MPDNKCLDFSVQEEMMIKRVLCVLTLALVLAGSAWADGKTYPAVR